MDKREFYKELMSEYMFDKNKILANAKKGKMAGRKPLPLYIGMTAAAAAIITISGVSIAMHVQDNPGVVLNPNGSIMELTPEERVKIALEQLQQNRNSTEMHDVLVSFSSPLAPPQAHGVLASQSDVNVRMLIMDDDSRINTAEGIEDAFNGGTKKISGAVINCAGYQMAQIDESEFVDLVEILSKEDLADLMAIKPVITPPDSVKPDDTSKPDNDKPGVGGDKPNVPVVGVDDDPNPPVEGDNTSGGETSVPEDPENPDKPGVSINPTDPVTPPENPPEDPNAPVIPGQPAINTPKLPGLYSS